MALCKEVVSPKGFVIAYHKINWVDLRNGILSCELLSYVNKEYRDLKRPAQRLEYSFEITTEEEESMGIRQLAYMKIKELPEWSGVENC